MLKSATAAIRISEIRTRLNELNALPDAEVTDALRDEERGLVTEQGTRETEYRAALTSEADEHATVPVDAEDREYREVLGRGNVGRILSAVVEHRACDGAEAEVQQHRGLASNQIPLAMLRLPVEHRAVTTGPTNVGTTEQPAIMPVFAAGVGAFIGADRPTVDAGTVAYPVLDQRPDVAGPHTDSTAVDETTGSFSSSLLTPGRCQASYFYKRTDAARFSSLDMALRAALNSGLEEKLDKDLLGVLLRATNLENHAAGGVTSFADYLSQFGHSRVDGRYAAALADVRTVMGSGTYSHAGNQYRSTTADYSALDALDRKTSGVRVSVHVPAVASKKQNALVRLGMHDRAVLQVLWDGISLIPDASHEGQNRGDRDHGDPAGRDEDPPGREFPQAGSSDRVGRRGAASFSGSGV